MLAEAAPDQNRRAFEDLLHCALVHGQRPRPSALLGPATVSAIDAVARAHPEATGIHITDAYDAFDTEHG